MQRSSFAGVAPVAFLMFAAAVVTLFFPGALGLVVAFAALMVVAGVAAAADRIAGAREVSS